MSSGAIYIQSVGAVSPVGIGAAQIASSVRGGISRFMETSIYDRWLEPLRMALLPEKALPPLVDDLAAVAMPSREARMLRLAAMALRQAADALDEIASVPLFLGLPEPHPAMSVPSQWSAFLPRLRDQAGCPFRMAGSQIFPRGAAAAFLALEAALRCLADRGAAVVMVGGVDTFLDLALLATLDAEERLLGNRVADGFIPGEGAAFLVLARARGATSISAVGTARDPGHRYADTPHLGEGLSRAFEQLLTGRELPPARTVFAGLNGESFGVKEWGVARLRHSKLFDKQGVLEHPADCFGDTGAATGALLLALAHTALQTGQRPGPALAWAASDGEDRGVALLERSS